jgi:hypothetical protein
MDALRKCAEVADIIGAYFVVLDSLNERAAKLYREIGFIDLPNHEPRMLMNMRVVRAAIAEADK